MFALCTCNAPPDSGSGVGADPIVHGEEGLPPHHGHDAKPGYGIQGIVVNRPHSRQACINQHTPPSDDIS